MRKLTILILMIVSFIIGSLLSLSFAAYYWDKNTIAGGITAGGEGIPWKVAADGTLFIK